MFPPQRIVSLLPSSTEICFALGLGDRVVGVSHEWDFPPEVSGRPVLTSPRVNPQATSAEIDRQVRALVADGLSVYHVDEERLRELRPDLIITQNLCEVCAVSFADVRAVGLASPMATPSSTGQASARGQHRDHSDGDPSGAIRRPIRHRPRRPGAMAGAVLL